MDNLNILLVCDEGDKSRKVEALISEQGQGKFTLVTRNTLADASVALSDQVFDLLMLYLKDTNPSDEALLESIKEKHPNLNVVLLNDSSGRIENKDAKSNEDAGLELSFGCLKEHLNLKRALQTTEQCFQDFFEEDTDWIWGTDSDLRFNKFSDNFEMMSGMTRETFLSKQMSDVCDLESFGGDIEDFDRYTGNREPFRRIKFWSKDSSGMMQWFLMTGYPVFDHDNQFAGYKCSGKDVTLEKYAEQEVAQNKATLESILNYSNEGIMVLNAIFSSNGELADFSVSRVNKAAEEIIGSKHNNVIGKLMKIELPFLVNYGVFSLSEETLLKDEDFEVEVSFDEDRIKGWYRISGVKLSNSVILTFIDINNQKKAELEGRQASRLEAVGQLAGGIAHEINTPIQFIGDNLRFLLDAQESFGRVRDKYLALIETLKDKETFSAEIKSIEETEEEEDLQFLLEEIPLSLQQSLEGTGQVRDIVMAMKEFSHPGTKSSSNVDINHALETMLTVSKNEWKHCSDIELDLSPSMPFVMAMPSDLNQVFLILIVNAAHAIKEKDQNQKGLIRINTSHDDQWAEVRISDSGTGIPDEIAHKIYDPFFTTKDVGQGTGQGLSIAYDIITNKHQGKIDFETRPEQGTTFIIRLPIGEMKP